MIMIYLYVFASETNFTLLQLFSSKIFSSYTLSFVSLQHEFGPTHHIIFWSSHNFLKMAKDIFRYFFHPAPSIKHKSLKHYWSSSIYRSVRFHSISVSLIFIYIYCYIVMCIIRIGWTESLKTIGLYITAIRTRGITSNKEYNQVKYPYEC